MLKSGVFEGKNLVLVILMVSGKIFVSEIVMVNKFLSEGGKVVYLVFFKVLVEEKYCEFKEWEVFGFRVVVMIGDYDLIDEWFGRYDIIVVIVEKFDFFLRYGVSWIKDVKLVVVDEVYFIGFYDRGVMFEMIFIYMFGKV